MNLEEELSKVISLLKNNEFIKAHDFCEELWREYKNDSKTRQESFILKAFVNGIACLELLKMNRKTHSENVWKTYLKYIDLIDELDTKNKEQYKVIEKLICEIKAKIKDKLSAI